MAEISFFNKSFWDLWLQKIFRNIASVKYQWLLLIYIPTVWGMFHGPTVVAPATWEPYISSALGLGLLGGGFVTLATSRIIANTSLTGTKTDEMDTDK